MWSVSRKLPNGNTQQIDMGVPGHPREVGVWRSDGAQVIGHTAEYRLVIRRDYTDTVRVIEAPASQLVLSGAERDSVFEAAITDQPEAWRDAIREMARADQIPADRPLWTGIATDRSQRIWVALPGPGRNIATLDVFTADGVLLGKVPAPHPNILDGFWTRDRLYFRDQDPEGRPLVRVFRLDTETVRSATP
jgi:hypothetical protein